MTFLTVFVHPYFSFFSAAGNTKNSVNLTNARLSRQNSDVAQRNKPQEHTIDCGDIVWSLAFGSSVPEKQSRCVNIEWHRFKFGQDQLLLATGLGNGRIKIWDVYTGSLSSFLSFIDVFSYTASCGKTFYFLFFLIFLGF